MVAGIGKSPLMAERIAGLQATFKIADSRGTFQARSMIDHKRALHQRALLQTGGEKANMAHRLCLTFLEKDHRDENMRRSSLLLLDTLVHSRSRR
jgi:hypothetical protein